MTELRDTDESPGARPTAVHSEAAPPVGTVYNPKIAHQLGRLHGKEAVAIFPWLAVAVVGLFFFFFEKSPFGQFGLFCWFLATIMFVYHCRALAERKGYSRSLGFLSLVPPYIGLAYLVWLPGREKRKEYQTRRREQLGRWPGPTYK